MRSKLSELALNIATSSYDIIALVETNLSQNINTSELGFNGYNVYRCDRSVATSDKLSGGGVLVAVNVDIPSLLLPTPDLFFEQVFVSCVISSHRFLIGCTYIPPNQPASVYSDYCDSVDEVISSTGYSEKVLLLGDFNIPDVDWSSEETLHVKESSRYLWNLASTHNLKQINAVHNSRGVCLDLVFSSVSTSVISAAADVLVIEDRHHPALSFSLFLSDSAYSRHYRLILDYRRTNLDAIFHSLQGLTFPVLDQAVDIDNYFTDFCLHLKRLVEQYTPIKKLHASSFPKWFTNDLKCLVARKKAVHKKYKSTGLLLYLDEFRQLRKQCKDLATQCLRDYTQKVEDSISSNIKSFWAHVNSLKSSSTIPSRLTFDLKEAHDAKEGCEIFSEYFSSVFSDAPVNITAFDFGWNFTISHFKISPTVVQRKLDGLNPNKGAGPDGIPPIVLKFCSSILSPHLAILFSHMLANGIFPSFLKQGYVVPVFKSGDRSNVRNYRPIVIQSAVAKIYESIVMDYLYFHLQKCLSPGQHGFLRSRSTVSNLLVLQDYIMSAFGDSCQVDCVYLDLSKAFDKVNHSLLVAKLAGYGIGGPMLKWLDSYLRNRTLIVKCNGSTSLPFKVSSGVPQGSHLGPLLFNLFINDVALVILTSFLMFADDIKIFGNVSSVQGQIELQQSLSNIAGWCLENGMELNALKCSVMSFKRGPGVVNYDYTLYNCALKRVDRMKDLGIVMTPSLSPLEHILHITSRANSLLGFIFRCTRNFNSPLTLVVLFKTLVRPILEYGSVIWSPYQRNHMDLVQQIQTKFIRMLGPRLGYTYRNTPVNTVEQLLNIPSLHLRRQHSDLLFLYKLVKGRIDCHQLLVSIGISIPRGTRSRTVFCRRFHPTNYAYHSGISRLLRCGSVAATSIDFFIESEASFRCKLQQFVLT